MQRLNATPFVKLTAPEYASRLHDWLSSSQFTYAAAVVEIPELCLRFLDEFLKYWLGFHPVHSSFLIVFAG